MKVEITSFREGFNKVQNSLLLRDKLGICLAEAKGITDKILKREFVEIELDDLAFIEKLGKGGVNLNFKYQEDNEIFEGCYDEHGFTYQKIKSKFSTEEIEATLSQMPYAVLVKVNGSLIIMNQDRNSTLLIENEYLAEDCKQYLIDRGVKIYDSVD